MRLSVRLILLVALALVAWKPAEAAPEFRGLWVDAFHPGFKDHDQVVQMVQWAKAANFNALIVQVRKRGDAYYDSAIEPKASDISPDYDPLHDIIENAHAAKLEVHAWLSVYEVMLDSKWSKPGPKHITQTHPEWIMTSKEGIKVFDQGKVYMDPGVPGVNAYIISVVEDILQKYEVDGISLDNLRYPGLHGGYNPISVQRFNQQLGRTGLPAMDDEAWGQWRRQQITNLVGGVQAAMRSLKPKVKLSASVVFAAPSMASNSFLQEWDVWTREGIVDFLMPMVFLRQDTMLREAGLALSYSGNRHIYIGLASWMSDREQGIAQLKSARTAGAKGVVLYNYHYLGPQSTQARCAKDADLLSSAFAQPADVPAMPWMKQ